MTARLALLCLLTFCVQPCLPAAMRSQGAQGNTAKTDGAELDRLLAELRKLPPAAWAEKRASLVAAIEAQKRGLAALEQELARFDALSAALQPASTTKAVPTKEASEKPSDIKVKKPADTKPADKSAPEKKTPAKTEPEKKPKAQETATAELGPLVHFDRDVRPIFEAHCTTCHDSGGGEAGLDLSTLTGALQGGSSGKVIEPFDPAGSRLLRLVQHLEKPTMPPDEPALAKAKQETLRRWIELGAPVDDAAAKRGATRLAAERAKQGKSKTAASSSAPRPGGLKASTTLDPAHATPLRAMALQGKSTLALAAAGELHVFDVFEAQKDAAKGAADLRFVGLLELFPQGRIEALRFSPSGTKLALVGGRPGRSGLAVLVEVSEGKVLARVEREGDAWTSVDVRDDGVFVVGGAEPRLRIFDGAGRALREVSERDWVVALRFSPDGERIASLERRGRISVHSFEDAKFATLQSASLELGVAATTSLCWSPRGDRLLCVGADGGVRQIASAPNGKGAKALRSLATTQLHGAGGVAIEAVEDGYWSLAADASLVRLDAAVRSTATARISARGVACLCATSDGKRCFVGDLDGKLHSVVRAGRGLAVAPTSRAASSRPLASPSTSAASAQ